MFFIIIVTVYDIYETLEPEPTELVQKIDSIFSRKKRAYEEAFKKRFPRDQRYVNQQEILSFVPKPASLRSDISPGPKKCPSKIHFQKLTYIFFSPANLKNFPLVCCFFPYLHIHFCSSAW